MCWRAGGRCSHCLIRTRAEKENINVQKLRFSSVLLTFISIPIQFWVSMISLSPVIVENSDPTLLLFKLDVLAKGFAVTLRNLKTAHTHWNVLQTKSLVLDLEIWLSAVIHGNYLSFANAHCSLRFPYNCNLSLAVFMFYWYLPNFPWMLSDILTPWINRFAY